MTAEKGQTVKTQGSVSQLQQRHKYVLVIHGGAGTMTRAGATPEKIEAYRAALREALNAGYKTLSQGGEAMDAAVAAVTVMEGNPDEHSLTCFS